MIVFEQFLGPCLFFAVFIRYTVWLFVFEITLARSIPWIISAIGKNYVSMRRKKKKTEKQCLLFSVVSLSSRKRCFSQFFMLMQPCKKVKKHLHALISKQQHGNFTGSCLKQILLINTFLMLFYSLLYNRTVRRSRSFANLCGYCFCN